MGVGIRPRRVGADPLFARRIESAARCENLSDVHPAGGKALEIYALFERCRRAGNIYVGEAAGAGRGVSELNGLPRIGYKIQRPAHRKAVEIEDPRPVGTENAVVRTVPEQPERSAAPIRSVDGGANIGIAPVAGIGAHRGGKGCAARFAYAAGGGNVVCAGRVAEAAFAVCKAVRADCNGDILDR